MFFCQRNTVQNRTGKLRDIIVNSILAIWQIIRRDLYCLDHRCSYPASSNLPASAPLQLALLSGTFYGVLRLFKGPWLNWTVTPHSSTWEFLQLPANSHIFYATNQMSQTGQSQSLEEKKKSLPALDESCVGPTGDFYSGISYLPLDVADLYSILTSTMGIGGSWLSSHPIWKQGMSSSQWAWDKWSCYQHTVELTRAVTEVCELSPYILAPACSCCFVGHWANAL